MASKSIADVNKVIAVITEQMKADKLLITELTEQFSTYKTSMAAELNQVHVVHAKELAELKLIYDNKIASLEEKLITVINTDANATLRTVTGFFQTHDTRMSELACSIDVNDERSNKNAGIIDSIVSEVKQLKSDKCQQHVTRHVINDIDDDVVVGNGGLSLRDLESRIDTLEDYSRRDNLLFFGFEEQKNEDCTEKVKHLICNKILAHDRHAKDIDFVRVHRLGRYKAGSKRPIIARFKDYGCKTAVLKSRRNLAGMKLLVTEDFCTNTKNTREYLETCAKTISNKKKDEISGAYVQFKSLVIKGTNGKTRSFSRRFVQDKIDEHPSDWWDHISYSGTTPSTHAPIIPEPVVDATMGNDVEVVSDTVEQDPKSPAEESTEVASNEEFKDAVDVPEGGDAPTTAEKELTP